MRLWITKKTNEDTLYREILAPFYFRPRCQGANLKLAEFLCLKLSLLKHNFIWAKLRQGETVCK